MAIIINSASVAFWCRGLDIQPLISFHSFYLKPIRLSFELRLQWKTCLESSPLSTIARSRLRSLSGQLVKHPGKWRGHPRTSAQHRIAHPRTMQRLSWDSCFRFKRLLLIQKQHISKPHSHPGHVRYGQICISDGRLTYWGSNWPYQDFSTAGNRGDLSVQKTVQFRLLRSVNQSNHFTRPCFGKTFQIKLCLNPS